MPKKPCCRNPDVRFIGTRQCNSVQTSGVSAIRWHQCRTCLTQIPELVLTKDQPPPVPRPDPEKAVRPTDVPICCRQEMTWLGRESKSTGRDWITFDSWQCCWCTRTLRIPHEEPPDGDEDNEDC